MFDFLQDFFISYGYTAIFFVLVLCGFGIPIPEDVTLVAGGVISGLGYTNVHTMFAVGMIGVLVGDGLMFIIGKIYGDRVLKFKPIARLLNPKRYAQVQQKFDKYGNRVLFIARFLPGLRSPIFLSAGMSGKVSIWQWLLMDGLAALISVPFWIYLGNYGAENTEQLMHQVKHFQHILLGIIGLGASYGIWIFWKKQRNLQARKESILAKRRARKEARNKKSPDNTQ